MQALIIEDEQLTAEDLAGILLNLPDGINVTKILSSVKEAVNYLQTESLPDLIFCDIQLGDGHSFEIFRQVQTNVPVIFCTAYNEYALDAFANNGIAYVLKPFTKRSVKEAVDKFGALKKFISKTDDSYSRLFSVMQQQVSNKPGSLLVNWKEKILPIKINDIALFSIELKTTRLFTKDNQSYSINYTLDELEQMCSHNFYRANRQYLINRDAVQEVLQFTARKLFVKLSIKGDFDITIAKVKVPEFLSWLKS